MLLSLCVIESMLWVAALASPRVALLLSPGIPKEIPDPVLGLRPNPALPDHDSRGYRNAAALERADIVVLGDSQTYGSEVSRGNAWPQLLGERLEVPVYNMSLGGWGPSHYFLLADQALALQPKLLIVALYAGNDFRDAYRHVMRDEVSELRVGSPLSRDAYEALDSEKGRLGRVWSDAKAARRGRFKVWLRWLLDPFEQHLKLWGLVRGLARIESASEVNVKRDSVREDVAGYARKVEHLSHDYYFPFQAGAGVGTILTPAGRATVADRSDPRVQEGVRISLVAIAALKKSCEGRCDFLVVTIPTKEYAFGDAVAAAGVEAPDVYLDLVRREAELWADIQGELDSRGIPWVDTRPALSELLESGRNPYHGDWDGHPTVAGNEAIAELVARHSLLDSLR